MEEKEKNCGGCKRFREYYLKRGKEGRRIRYIKSEYGFCYVKNRYRHMYSYKKACEKWEQ